MPRITAEVRLYRIIRAFQELTAMRVCSLDRIVVDPNYLDAAEAMINQIRCRLQTMDVTDRETAALIGSILKPDWDAQ